MQILVACEESQAVTIALRKLGHEAYSCDLIPCSGGHPEWHIQQDVLPLLNGYCFFKTCDGSAHYVLGRWDMLERPVKGRERRGYGWCGGLCRWGTTCKLRTIDQYAERQGAKVYVGIAADETPRLQKERKPYKLFPLAEFGMTEADCLQYCYSAGYFWLEGSIRLYDILDRVSCWCCCNKNLKELRNIRQYLPEYWEKLKHLQAQLERPMKGFYKGQPRGVFELDERFAREDRDT